MATTYSEYSADAEIDAFFQKTSATRSACDAKARELAGDSKLVPVDVQGVCSYSVYAGPELEYVVQFRLKSLALKTEITSLATEIYGEEDANKEPLYAYLMTRVRGVTHLDFILAHGFPKDLPENLSWRRTLIGEVAHFMALSWKARRPVSPEYRDALRQTYVRDLQRSRGALPPRFRPIIETCLKSMDDIISLPMVLLHRDFGSCNIIVDEATCHLVGVIDWADAEVCPFGLNLHSVQPLTGKLHLRKNGWSRCEDYDALKHFFWERFREKIGGLSDNQLRTIKLARALGLLLSSGLTSRLANEPQPVPIGDDEQGRYNMSSLDGLLINPQTRFDGLEY